MTDRPVHDPETTPPPISKGAVSSTVSPPRKIVRVLLIEDKEDQQRRHRGPHQGGHGSSEPLTVHRHVSSGSSFGANPLEQHFGLGKAKRVAHLEIHWPTSGTTQVFHDIEVNQGLVVTEFADNYQKRSWQPIPLPK